MNTAVFRLALVFAVAALGGCASSPISRIDANRAKYESWPLEVQEVVLAGEARNGMTREQVEVAKGKPSEVVPRGASGDEIWVYRQGGGTGSGLLGNTGISLGTGIGGVGVNTNIGGGGAQTSIDEEEVIFEDGVVVRRPAGH
jgi:hypothetical protein